MSKRQEWFGLRFDAAMKADSVGEILIYSAIVRYKWDGDDPEVTALEFDKALKNLKDVSRLNIRINSPGGLLDQAVAMRTMLAGHPAPEKHIYIEGLCASAATLLASIPGCAVHIAEGSMYMIHNPMCIAYGNANELEKQASLLRIREADCRAMYARRCKKDDATIKAWMDETKWFNARQAVDEGFADELLEAGAEAAACATVSPGDMLLMRDMYAVIPDEITVREEGGKQAPPTAQEPVSNAGAAADAALTPEHTNNTGEEHTAMEFKDITGDQLMKERPDLFTEISGAGAEAERARIADIDDMTPPGYEQMAAEAKKSGESAVDYHKRIVKAQREKGAAFLANRQAETAGAAGVAGGASEDDANPDAAMDSSAKEIAEYAKAHRAGGAGTMY